MNITGITWRGPVVDDDVFLRNLPPSLQRLLQIANGFILHQGALHIRGVARTHAWHSIREAAEGKYALHRLYDAVLGSDIPFAQDQLGDQYLMRGNGVIRLKAETGEIESFAEDLQSFLSGVENDIEDYLNVGLDHQMEPGQLLLAWPPFCVKESGEGQASLRALPVDEVIALHAKLARQLKSIPDGGRIQLDWGP